MSTEEKTNVLPQVASVTVGTQLSGIYELDERIAFGGMGEVYRGHNIQTGDPVAIKIVLPELARDPMILSLFKKEASVLNHLAHEAIVRYHVFTIDHGIGRPYLAMEFVDGQSLVDLMQQGPMSPENARKLCARLASGLSAAHELGIIHRDLSPDNIILPGGKVERAKIIDFGIARSATIGGETLIGGKFAGKYNYVSPEQLGLFGGDVSERSDIYSLGLVLAAALRGGPIDMSGSQLEIVEKRRATPDLSGIDDSVRWILEAMLQPEPSARPASMAAVVDMARGIEPSWPPQTSAPLPAEEAAASLAAPPPQPDAPVSLHPWVAASQAETMSDGLEEPPLRSVDGAGASDEPPDQPGADVEPKFVAHVRPSFLDTDPRDARKQANAPRRGNAGRLAAVAATLLIVVAGGTAYLSGVFTPAGPSSEGQETREQPPLPQDEVAAPAPEPAKDQDSTPTTEEPTPTAQPVEPSAGPATPQEPAPAEPTTTVEPAPTEEPTPGAEPTPTAGPAPTPEPPTEPAPDPQPPATPVELPAPQEPGETIDAVAERISWLRSYAGGQCFYATAISATDKAIQIEGFGTTVEPFMELLKSFQATFKMEPDVGVRLIDPAQCVVTDFLRDLPRDPQQMPQLTLDRTSVPNGTAISGRLADIGGRKTELILIDHKGIAFNLNSRLTAQGDAAAFNIPIGLSAADQAAKKIVPQVIIALTSPDGLHAAEFSTPTPAAELLPRILAEMKTAGAQAAAAAKYFRLGG